jgi:hypothetical protein
MFRQIQFSRLFLFVGSLAVIVVFLAACGSQSVATSASNVPAQTTSASTNTNTPAAAGAGSPTTASSGAVSFSKDIAPILQNTCISCHGGDRTEKNLDLKTYASLMAGSENGAVIAPGDAANSLLIQKVQSGNMPKRKPHLLADQIQLLVNWVNAGAQNN